MIIEQEVIRPEAQMYRFFWSYTNAVHRLNRTYRLKSLVRNLDGSPTTKITYSKGRWTYCEARDYTALCLSENVPDVTQRISGNFETINLTMSMK